MSISLSLHFLLESDGREVSSAGSSWAKGAMPLPLSFCSCPPDCAPRRRLVLAHNGPRATHFGHEAVACCCVGTDSPWMTCHSRSFPCKVSITQARWMWPGWQSKQARDGPRLGSVSALVEAFAASSGSGRHHRKHPKFAARDVEFEAGSNSA